MWYPYELEQVLHEVLKSLSLWRSRSPGSDGKRVDGGTEWFQDPSELPREEQKQIGTSSSIREIVNNCIRWASDSFDPSFPEPLQL